LGYTRNADKAECTANNLTTTNMTGTVHPEHLPLVMNPLLMHASQLFGAVKEAAAKLCFGVAAVLVDHTGSVLANAEVSKATTPGLQGFLVQAAASKTQFLLNNNLNASSMCQTFACAASGFAGYLAQKVGGNEKPAEPAQGARMLHYMDPTAGEVVGFLSVAGCMDQWDDVKIACHALRAVANFSQMMKFGTAGDCADHWRVTDR